MSSSVSNMKKNQNGGFYENGKSLSMEVRYEIVQRYIRKEKVTKIAKDMKLTHGVVSKITQHYQKTGEITPRNVKTTNKDVSASRSLSEQPPSAESIQKQTKSTLRSTTLTPNSISSTTSGETVFSASAFPNGTLPSNMDASTLMILAQLNLAMMTPMPNFPLQPAPVIPPLQVQALQMQTNALAISACAFIDRHGSSH